MAGLSRSIFTLLEVLTSSDLMQALRLQGRDTLEIARYVAGDRGVILGGLSATAGPTGVSIAPGVLLEPYAGVVSVPRADESSTILGLSRAAIAQPVPALGVDTWYLVEARAAELDTMGSRNVANQSLGTTAPATVLVQREASLLTRARVGTATALPALAAGWQPIAAVLRRTTGAVLAADVYDLRTLCSDLEAVPESERFTRHDYAVQNRGSGESVADPTVARLQLDVALTDRFGQHLSARVPSVLVSSLLAPGYTPGSEEWGYLYLATLGDVAPRTATGRGVLVMSPTPPVSQGSRTPASPIALPAPWGGLGAAARATCIGCIRTTVFSLGDYLAAQSCIGGHYAIGNESGPRMTAAGPLVPVSGTGPYLPVNARSAVLSVHVDPAPTTEPAFGGVGSEDPNEPSAGYLLPIGLPTGLLDPLWLLGTNPANLVVSCTPPFTSLKIHSAEL